MTEAMQIMQNAMQMMQNAMQMMQNAMQMMQNNANDAKRDANDANLHMQNSANDANGNADTLHKKQYISNIRRRAALIRWHGYDANDANLHMQNAKSLRKEKTEKEIPPCTPLKEKEKKEKNALAVPARTRTHEGGEIYAADIDRQLPLDIETPVALTGTEARAREDNANYEDNENNENNEKHAKPAHPRRIIPPTVEMVAGYCRSRQNSINASAFVDFYTAKGWMIGKDRMKDWQAAVRTWEHRHKTAAPTDTNNANNANNIHNHDNPNPQTDLTGNNGSRKPYSRIQEFTNTRFTLD